MTSSVNHTFLLLLLWVVCNFLFPTASSAAPMMFLCKVFYAESILSWSLIVKNSNYLEVSTSYYNDSIYIYMCVCVCVCVLICFSALFWLGWVWGRGPWTSTFDTLKKTSWSCLNTPSPVHTKPLVDNSVSTLMGWPMGSPAPPFTTDFLVDEFKENTLEQMRKTSPSLVSIMWMTRLSSGNADQRS